MSKTIEHKIVEAPSAFNGIRKDEVASLLEEHEKDGWELVQYIPGVQIGPLKNPSSLLIFKRGTENEKRRILEHLMVTKAMQTAYIRNAVLPRTLPQGQHLSVAQAVIKEVSSTGIQVSICCEIYLSDRGVGNRIGTTPPYERIVQWEDVIGITENPDDGDIDLTLRQTMTLSDDLKTWNVV